MILLFREDGPPSVLSLVAGLRFRLRREPVLLSLDRSTPLFRLSLRACARSWCLPLHRGCFTAFLSIIDTQAERTALNPLFK